MMSNGEIVFGFAEASLPDFLDVVAVPVDLRARGFVGSAEESAVERVFRLVVFFDVESAVLVIIQSLF